MGVINNSTTYANLQLKYGNIFTDMFDSMKSKKQSDGQKLSNSIVEINNASTMLKSFVTKGRGSPNSENIKSKLLLESTAKNNTDNDQLPRSEKPLFNTKEILSKFESLINSTSPSKPSNFVRTNTKTSILRAQFEKLSGSASDSHPLEAQGKELIKTSISVNELLRRFEPRKELEKINQFVSNDKSSDKARWSQKPISCDSKKVSTPIKEPATEIDKQFTKTTNVIVKIDFTKNKPVEWINSLTQPSIHEQIRGK